MEKEVNYIWKFIQKDLKAIKEYCIEKDSTPLEKNKDDLGWVIVEWYFWAAKNPICLIERVSEQEGIYVYKLGVKYIKIETDFNYNYILTFVKPKTIKVITKKIIWV